MLQREAARAGDILDPKQESDIGIPNRDALEIIVVPPHQVEKILAAVAIEDHFAVARAFDDDRFFGRAALRQIVGAVERRAVGGDGAVEAAIDEPIVFVDAGVHEDDVARLNARRQRVGMIGLIRAHVVRGHQTGERRLLLGAFVTERIDVIDVAAFGGLRLLARAHGDGPLRFAFHAVGIGKNEAAFVFGVGLQIQKAAGEHVGRDVTVVVVRAFARSAAGDGFVLQAQKRETLAPLLIASLAERDVHARVAIVVARDAPLESERDERWRIDDEFARGGRVLGPRDCARGQKCCGKQEKRESCEMAAHFRFTSPRRREGRCRAWRRIRGSRRRRTPCLRRRSGRRRRASRRAPRPC